ncbi:MAG: quinone oxidoreductase [Reyranellaceae bacterium]
MVKAIRFHETGGPEVLRYEDVELGKPGRGEALVRHTAIGLNFIDIYFRSGLYPTTLPSGLGMEGAGIVEAVGPGVKDIKPGDRVAYAGRPVGAYAEARVMPAEGLVKVPAGVSDQQAAAMMLQGMTVEYLLRRTYRLKKDDICVLHAAAGGVGLIFCQWARAIGAKVIGVVSSDDKAKLAKAHGAKWTVVTSRENFVERVKAITKGKGVPVVYDSIGKDTWSGSLDCLSPRGLMVSFGNASGPVGPVDLGILSAKGSLYVTRPTLMSYTATRPELLACARALFKMVADKKVKIRINQTYALQDAAQAHADLAARKTTGSTVLIP